MTKDERLLIAIDAELKDRLQAAASFEGVSMSEMVRRLIAQVPVVGYVDGELIHMADAGKEIFDDKERE